MNKKKIVLVTGGFDPLHSGHIKYFKAACKFGDKIVVGLNSDEWLKRKKGQSFMSWSERATIVAALYSVDRVMDFDDSDNSAKDAIRKVKSIFPNHDIIFANGGDRTEYNTPEMELLKEYDNLQFVFGVGGSNKQNSSSWILAEWKAPKIKKDWGHYRILHQVEGTKVREITVNPDQRLSMQRHANRSEYWHVTSGKAVVCSTMPNGYGLPALELDTHDNYQVPKGEWHQLTNPFDIPCKLVEIQFGSACNEEDIERRPW